jgi:15-cis-phytoene synthase
MKADCRVSKAVLAHHSKSFALAGRLFPPGPREDAAAVYAWCRGCDDAVDLEEPGRQAEALRLLADRLDRLYGGEPGEGAVEIAFQEVIQERSIPRCYPGELLAGLRMDVLFQRYETMDDLLLYCYRVAGTVGLMMCHVMGVADPRALRHAAHLGMAMQLTNISRDVMEDWGRGHIYLPDELLGTARAEDLWARRGQPLPREHGPQIAGAVALLLKQAAALYRSGDAGMRWLSWRCALAVRTARHVYAGIGGVLAARDHDVWAGRAIVPSGQKLVCVARAFRAGLGDLPRCLWHGTPQGVPTGPLPYSDELSLD